MPFFPITQNQPPKSAAQQFFLRVSGGSELYAANGASNDVSVVDLKSCKGLRRIKVGDGPWGNAIVNAAKQSVR
jgi:YVTN family beta-propeller protein